MAILDPPSPPCQQMSEFGWPPPPKEADVINERPLTRHGSVQACWYQKPSLYKNHFLPEHFIRTELYFSAKKKPAICRLNFIIFPAVTFTVKLSSCCVAAPLSLSTPTPSQLSADWTFSWWGHTGGYKKHEHSFFALGSPQHRQFLQNEAQTLQIREGLKK